MEEKIALQLLWKRFAGNNMKIFFGQWGKSPEKVLVFSNVVAFIDNEEYKDVDNYLLQIREGFSVYGLDMSMRLKMPDYKNYPETFLFAGNNSASGIRLRILAEKVNWYNYNELPAEHLNY